MWATPRHVERGVDNHPLASLLNFLEFCRVGDGDGATSPALMAESSVAGVGWGRASDDAQMPDR